MFYERDIILRDLRENVMRVTFVKVNGENRIMNCTLRPDMLPPSYVTEETKERAFHQENPNVISCWDLQAKGWRSFRIDSVTYIEDIGESY
jgi:hypothetical protein